MKNRFTLLLCFLLFVTLAIRCSKDAVASKYKTQNVLVVVVDGARYTETWGFPTRQFIPHRAAMLSQGVLCDRFYNDGYTFTNAGHTAICTGLYQNINNGGTEYPQGPSYMQVWRKTYSRPAYETWIVTTKDKLEVLSNCEDPVWKNVCRPKTDCGVAGLGTGYREDSTTFTKASTILASSHPRLMLINFKQPDAAGHAGDSLAYLQGIMDTDNYIYQLWQQLQTDPFYKGSTTLIVTNDHGRHTAGHLDGFISHTDYCEGCKRIEFFGIGPDFKQNYTSNVQYSQRDIANTIAELMSFSFPTAQGKVIKDVFR